MVLLISIVAAGAFFADFSSRGLVRVGFPYSLVNSRRYLTEEDVIRGLLFVAIFADVVHPVLIGLSSALNPVKYTGQIAELTWIANRDRQ